MENNQQNKKSLLSSRLKIAIPAIFLSFLFVPGLSYAHGSWSHHGCDSYARSNSSYPSVKMLSHSLNLTDAQEERISSILDTQKTKVGENDKLIRKNQKELFGIATSPSFEQTMVDQLTKSISQLMANSLAIRAQSIHQIYQLLDRDQKKKFEDRLDRFESCHNRT